eukprot:scaffold3042_cov313-Prasinococcus_capsulatus_cf.AAC.6
MLARTNQTVALDVGLHEAGERPSVAPGRCTYMHSLGILAPAIVDSLAFGEDVASRAGEPPAPLRHVYRFGTRQVRPYESRHRQALERPVDAYTPAEVCTCTTEVL